MSRLLLLTAFVSLAACGPGPADPDTGSAFDGSGDTEVPDDAVVSDDAEIPDAVGADANACTGEGRFECGGIPRMCCGGVWRQFFDGPCWTRDAGAPGCADGPAPGCACTEEGVVECRAFTTSVTCTGGVWTDMPGQACCFF